MALDGWKLYAALDDPPLTASPVYTEAAGELWGGEVVRGRNYYLDESQTNTAKFTLIDEDEDWHPQNPAGFVYGKKPVRKRFLYGPVFSSVFVPMYSGFLRSLPRRYTGIGGFPLVDLTFGGLVYLLDWYKKTFDIGTEGDPFDTGEELSGARIIRLLDESGAPGTASGSQAGWRDIDAGSSLMQGGISLEKRSIIEHLLHVAKSEDGRLFEAADGTLTWIARQSLYESPYNTVQLTFADENSGVSGVRFQPIAAETSDAMLYNHWVGNILDGPDIEVEDAGSIEEYGPSTNDSLSNMLITSEEEMGDRLYYSLGTHAEPIERIPSISVDVWSQPEHWEAFAALEQQTRCRLVETSRNGHTTDIEAAVEQLRHTWDFQSDPVTGLWNCTAALSLADPYAAAYWRLGVVGFSEVGQTTRFAY